MEINNHLSSDRVDNFKRFNSPFFNQFDFKEHTLKLSENINKTYCFPTFYTDICFAAIAFKCSYKKAKKLMPHAGLKPVKLPGGNALIVFSCYEYKTVHEMKPYNEVGFLIPVLSNATLNVPILPLITGQLFRKFGYHALCMPVTSLESKIRGDEIWGLPKQLNAINYTANETHFTCSIHETTGDEVVWLKIPKAGKSIHLDETTFLYTTKEGKLLKSQTWFKGESMVNTFPKQLFKSTIPEDEFIKIGNSGTGKKLRFLEIEEHPFQTRFTNNLMSAFDLPLKDYPI